MHSAAAVLDLLDHRHHDGDGQVGLAHAAGANQQQVLGLQQPGVAAGEHLQLLAALRLEILMVKTIKTLLPLEMGIPQQVLAACH